MAAGGGQDLRPGNPYFDTMALIMDWAMADFDATGEVFPIHFTCLGWEAVAVKVAHNPYILSARPCSAHLCFRHHLQHTRAALAQCRMCPRR